MESVLDIGCSSSPVPKETITWSRTIGDHGWTQSIDKKQTFVVIRHWNFSIVCYPSIDAKPRT
jgi:hypothetical protein